MNSDLLQSATLAIWLLCAAIGILGLRLPYQRFHFAADPPPVIAATLRVDLPPPPPSEAARVESALTPPVPQQAAPEPPPPPEVVQAAEAPPLVELAAPAPAPAFAVPVTPPPAVELPKTAVAPVVARPPTPAAPAAAAPVRHLTLGVGEGQQPDPQYPREAAIAREQGTVIVQFTVGADGSVVAAELAKSCRWPLLNQAALRQIRQHWRFRPGTVRTFDISIEFRLPEQ